MIAGRRQWLQTLLVGGLMIPVFPRLLRAMARLPEGRSIYRLQGKVLVNGALANEATRIVTGDTIETGPRGEVVFAVEADAFLVRQNSKLLLQGDGATARLLRVITGAVLSVYGAGAKKIRTPVATIGVRGSATYIESQPKQTYICTCYGMADIAANADPKVADSVETRHHEAPRYVMILPDGTPAIREAPVINHTDQELVLLESLVGRVPLFLGDVDDEYGQR